MIASNMPQIDGIEQLSLFNPLLEAIAMPTRPHSPAQPIRSRRPPVVPLSERVERCRNFLKDETDPREVGDAFGVFGVDAFELAINQLSWGDRQRILELIVIDLGNQTL